MRTGIEKYIIIIICKLISISYVYSHIQEIFTKSQRIFNTKLKLNVYGQQSEWEDCSRLGAQGHQLKLLCHLSHRGQQI